MRLLILVICIYAGNYPLTNGNNLPVKDSAMSTFTNVITIEIGSQSYKATLYNNPTVEAFKELLPLSINMVELNQNEKYYDLPKSLPTNASNPTTIENGDLMLYGSKTLVLFYKTFPTSYSYTKIGKIENPAGLAKTLGEGNVKVTFKLE
jgi:hypothetical protein|tara:strand:+ start:3176 stop:3625 length:450 start_codon:yes stop_codon:yes gene_type:complete